MYTKSITKSNEVRLETEKYDTEKNKRKKCKQKEI